MVQTITRGREQEIPLRHPEQVVDGFQRLSDAGMEGMIMGFLDDNEEIDHFGEAVMPLMREAGLRY